jgi:DNA-binding NtrC family response regulator
MTNPASQLTILIVSPLEDDYAALGQIFRTAGYHVRFARTCPEAWIVLHRERVDAVITECDFPDGLSWRDLLDEVHSLEGVKPVIVASHLADDRLWAEVLNLGGYDLLLKPFDAEETERVLAMAIRQARYSHSATSGPIVAVA